MPISFDQSAAAKPKRVRRAHLTVAVEPQLVAKKNYLAMVALAGAKPIDMPALATALAQSLGCEVAITGYDGVRAPDGSLVVFRNVWDRLRSALRELIR